MRMRGADLVVTLLGASALRAKPAAPLRAHPAVRMAEASNADTDEAGAPSPLSTLAVTAATAPVTASTAACVPTYSPDERRRNAVLAIVSPLAATALYLTQRANPVSAVALLKRMEEQSPALPDALATGRPTLVEFYAPWCTSCKEAAPSMMRLEKQYGDRVNFVVINGDDPRNVNAVNMFGVDGIPHLALISSKRQLAGTLIGDIPERVLDESLRALADGRPLPYGADPAPPPS